MVFYSIIYRNNLHSFLLECFKIQIYDKKFKMKMTKSAHRIKMNIRNDEVFYIIYDPGGINCRCRRIIEK